MRRQWVQINLELYEINDGVAVVDGVPWVCSNGKWRPAGESSPASYTILRDIEEFWSPVDGSHILGRGSLREHNKRNEVTDYRDFTETFAKARKEREVFRLGQQADKDRREIIAKEFYK